MAHYNFISAATGVASFAFQPTGGTYLTGAAGLIGIWSVDQALYLDQAAATEDKSFLDIYIPIHQELIENNLIDLNKIIKKIDESLEYTKSLEARVGRAKFLDSKGVGVIDPGAYSTSIILKEFFKEINNEKNN